MSGGLRILVLVQGTIGPNMSGPEIRGWEMARSLARRHTVTVAAREAAERVQDGIRIVPVSRRSIVRQARAHDVVVGPSLPPYLLVAASRGRTTIVADLYDPVELEVATLDPTPGVEREVAQRRAHRRLQLRFADMVLCAGERQRDRLLDELDGLSGAKRPRACVEVIPMGIEDEPADCGERPLRERFPGIAGDDRVVLWWGSIWRWFDAETAIQAIGRIAERRSDVKLVLTAGPPSRTKRHRMLGTEGARELAASLGLLGQHVFFLEEWIPYEERHAYLKEADIGISLHRDTPEAELAARARYMDYLWTALPCVLAEGDEVAREFGASGFARIVPPGDVDASADAILDLIEDSDLAHARARGEELAAHYRWPTLVERWCPALERLVASGDVRGRDAVTALPAVLSYYRRRAGDKLLAPSVSLRGRV